MIETAMVGRDGAFNAASALDGKVSLNKGIVQLAGSAGVIEVGQLRQLTDELKSFRSLLIGHEQVLFAQAQQSAACNASHTVEARMCRWLLHMRDLAGGDELILTQEFLAQMLGMQAAKRVARGHHAAKGGLNQIQSRQHPLAGHQGPKEGVMRVLRHGQGPLPAIVFALKIF